MLKAGEFFKRVEGSVFKWIVLIMAIIGGLLLLFLAIGSTIRSEKA